MRRKIIFGLLLLSVMSFGFKPEQHTTIRHYFKAHLKNNPNETIDGYTSTITGSNQVAVIFNRTGTDAGLYPVSVDFDVTYEGTQNGTMSFTLDLGTETHVTSWVNLTGTVIAAEMTSITPTYY